LEELRPVVIEAGEEKGDAKGADAAALRVPAIHGKWATSSHVPRQRQHGVERRGGQWWEGRAEVGREGSDRWRAVVGREGKG